MSDRPRFDMADYPHLYKTRPIRGCKDKKPRQSVDHNSAVFLYLDWWIRGRLGKKQKEEVRRLLGNACDEALGTAAECLMSLWSDRRGKRGYLEVLGLVRDEAYRRKEKDDQNN